MSVKLHCFGESGNSYKAALPLSLSHIAIFCEYEPQLNLQALL